MSYASPRHTTFPALHRHIDLAFVLAVARSTSPALLRAKPSTGAPNPVNSGAAPPLATTVLTAGSAPSLLRCAAELPPHLSRQPSQPSQLSRAAPTASVPSDHDPTRQICSGQVNTGQPVERLLKSPCILWESTRHPDLFKNNSIKALFLSFQPLNSCNFVPAVPGLKFFILTPLFTCIIMI